MSIFCKSIDSISVNADAAREISEYVAELEKEDSEENSEIQEEVDSENSEDDRIIKEEIKFEK